jgi:hypothetical protein
MESLEAFFSGFTHLTLRPLESEVHFHRTHEHTLEIFKVKFTSIVLIIILSFRVDHPISMLLGFEGLSFGNFVAALDDEALIAS